ncbi:MAG: HAMP domain-containing histidine kinase [Magnetococcales bacterium]|nr:HAMP domain-containing histidine kinase [Magnetococcales bacterium]
MSALTDDELMEELKKRFDHTKQTLHDLKIITKKLEYVNRKLEASEQIKSNFVSHMKNEINNPLTSILGLSQQLAFPEALNIATVKSIASMIHAEAFSLDFQLRNIFAAAELEAGETEMQVSLVDVDTLVLETAEMFQHQIRDKQLTVRYNRRKRMEQEGHLIFKTDSTRLQLLLANLLSNAIEFNRDKGSIDIRVTQFDDQLSLTIVDTGIGIDISQIDRIFDRFQQLESGRTKHHKGHGLGLSITKAIVDLMEGSITVADNSRHGDSPSATGCTFTITIPQIEMDIAADSFAVDGNEFFFGDGDQAEAF